MAEHANGANLLLGRGAVYATRADDVTPTERFVGNCTVFEITTTDEIKEKYSSTEAASPLLASVLVRRTIEIAMTLDEFTPENVAIAAMGTFDTDTIAFGVTSQIICALRFAGDPSAGPVFNLDAWKVAIQPDGPLGFISDDFAEMKLKGKVLSDAATVEHADFPYIRIVVPALTP